MPTISESLDAQIRGANDELTRLDADYAANKKAAQERLALLQTARAAVTPELDILASKLMAAGVWPRG